VGLIVFSAANEFEARLACDLLRAHDIPHRTSGAALTGLKGALPVPEAAITVEVLRPEDVERARALLAEVRRPGPESDDAWICMRCQEESPGSFDLCWKCGAARSVSAFSRTGSPYRGDRPVSRSEAPAPPVEPPRDPAAAGDVWRVLLFGCLPVAMLGIWFGRNQDLVWPQTSVGVAGIEELVTAVVLSLALRSFQARGVALRKLWGTSPRWAIDAAGALLLGGFLMVVRREGYYLVRSVARFPGHGVRVASFPISAGEWLLLSVGGALSAATGALLFFGIFLRRLRDLLGRGPIAGVLAIVFSAAILTLTWAPAASAPLLGGVFATQVVLGYAFLLIGRVWPVAAASFVGYLLEWLVAVYGS